MAAPVLTSMPDVLRAGETLKYTRSLQSYPASEGWTLAVALRGVETADATVTTNANGRDFDVLIPATTTAALDPGVYQWVERVTNGAEKYDAAFGVVTVLLNLLTATPGVAQTTNEKLLAAVEAKLSGRLTEDMEQFAIAGRSIARIPMKELLELRNQLRWAVWVESNQAKLGRTVEVVFPGPELRP